MKHNGFVYDKFRGLAPNLANKNRIESPLVPTLLDSEVGSH